MQEKKEAAFPDTQFINKIGGARKFSTSFSPLLLLLCQFPLSVSSQKASVKYVCSSALFVFAKLTSDGTDINEFYWHWTQNKTN